MILSNRDEVKIEGNTIELLSDLSVIVHCLHDDVFIKDLGMTEDEAKETIFHAVETGFVPREELRKKNDETIKDVLGDILEKAVDLLETLTKGRCKE